MLKKKEKKKKEDELMKDNKMNHLSFKIISKYQLHANKYNSIYKPKLPNQIYRINCSFENFKLHS